MKAYRIKMTDPVKRGLIAIAVLAIIAGCFVLSACSSVKKVAYTVMLPEGDNYTVQGSHILDVERGTNAVFDVAIADDCVFKGVNFGVFENGKLSVEDVRRDMTLRLEVVSNKTREVRYDANGGTFLAVLPAKRYNVGAHINLDNCHEKIKRHGYVLTGLNTEKNGGGKSYSLGALFYVPDASNDEISFYAEWEKCTPDEYLDYSVHDGSATVVGLSALGLSANLKKIVIPEEFDGIPVREIGADAFENLGNLEEFITNKNILTIERNFAGCGNLKKFTVFENLKDESLDWENLPENMSLKINSTLKIVYGGDTSNTAIADRFLRMERITDKKRIVIVSGSSGAYAIDSPRIVKEFDGEYDVVNLGLLGRHGVKAMLDVINALSKDGDIVVLKPEFQDQMYSLKDAEYYSNWRWLESNAVVRKQL